MLALDEQESHGESKAPRESHAPAHLNLPQCQEAAERNEAEEVPEGVKSARGGEEAEHSQIHGVSWDGKDEEADNKEDS